jgi:lycopene cyclase domain-containing protein
MAHLLSDGARSRKQLSLAAAVLVILAISFSLIIPTSSSASKIPFFPIQTSNGICNLHYTRFHLYFTIPQLALLYFLAAPFLTSLDWYKLYLLPVIAFVWTTPWDNELVRKEAWSYPKSCVLARIGYVPVEEYAFVSLSSND